MDEKHGQHPIASAPGASAVVVWSVYVLLAAFFYAPDIPPSAWAIGVFGLLACLAVTLNLAYWRLVVILASTVYLLFYAIRVIRMLGMTTDLEIARLLSALSFYYSASWQVTAGMLQERGIAAGWAHGFLEYAMPVLSLVLIGLAVLSLRSRRSASRVG